MNINTPSGRDDGPSTPIIPIAPTMIAKDDSDDDEVENEFVQRFTLPERFRLAEGGDMRQAYGLGKLVKKITGTVKKVAKSPIGKAALAGAAIYGLGGGTFFGKTLPGVGTSGGFAFRNIAPNLFGVAGAGEFGGSEGILGALKLTKGFGSKMPTALGAIAGTTALTAALTPKQEEEVDSLSKRIADRTGIDVTAIRKEVQDAYASGNTASLRTKYPFLIPETAAADGGRIGFDNGGTYKDFEEFMKKRGKFQKEQNLKQLQEEFKRYMNRNKPVEAAEGGMMDMGGMEMDLRGGGFVPIGAKEKADDVPARLSKNEFVFTADAVRAAGGGSVDKGADLMYKTMKQLENKVA
jgi:hypothetical protein